MKRNQYYVVSVYDTTNEFGASEVWVSDLEDHEDETFFPEMCDNSFWVYNKKVETFTDKEKALTFGKELAEKENLIFESNL